MVHFYSHARSQAGFFLSLCLTLKVFRYRYIHNYFLVYQIPPSNKNLLPTARLKRSSETFHTKFCATTMYVEHVSYYQFAFFVEIPSLQYAVAVKSLKHNALCSRRSKTLRLNRHKALPSLDIVSFVNVKILLAVNKMLKISDGHVM